MTTKLSDLPTFAQGLVTATLKIAACNHYMVGYEPTTTFELSYEDICAAHRYLVDLELADTKRRHSYNRAFMVLDTLCFRLHRAHLS